MRTINGVFMYLVALVCALPALAQPTLVFSTGGITHRGNFGGNPDERAVTLPTLPNLTAVGAPVPLQYAPTTRITNARGATSAGRGGLAAVTQPSFFGVTFAPTSNVTQTGNTDGSPASASSLRFDFRARWRIDNRAFGPGSTAGFVFNVVSSIPTSPTAFTALDVNASFRRVDANGNSISALRPAADGVAFFRNQPGNAISSVSNVLPITPDPIPVGAFVEISGSVTMRVHNEPEATFDLIRLANIAPTLTLFVREGPPESIELGKLNCPSIPDQFQSIFTVPDSGVQWFSFVIPSEVSVDAKTFLDFDTIGQLSPRVAFYDAGGSLVAEAFQNAISQRQARLTFGHGRRPGFFNGIDNDGRFGNLIPGTYYYAVGGPATQFAPGFRATPGTDPTFNARSLFATNVNDAGGCPLPDPVAPIPDLDLGVLIPTPLFTSVESQRQRVNWVRFTLPDELCLGNGASLDIDFPESFGGERFDAALYSERGDAVNATFADTVGLGIFGNAQLSFGNPFNPRPSFGGAPFAGQNGVTLPAGVYYLAIGPRAVDFRTHGWQAQTAALGPVNTQPLLVRINFASRSAPCGVCTVDFNRDGVLNQEDLIGFITAFLTEPALAGPSGTSVAPCPGQTTPYDALGYAADFDRDCAFTQEDLIGFITEYFTQAQSPTTCLPG